MAEVQQTQVLPAPFIEAAGKTYLDDLQKAVGQFKTADLSKAFGPQFVAGQDPLQKSAEALALTGIGGYQRFLQGAEASAGPQAYKQFESPYQQDVIQTTLDEFDRQAAARQQQISDAAVALGGFGGGREGVMQAEYQTQSDRNRAALQAQLQQQGFSQAQAARQADLQNQMMLSQGQLGLGAAKSGLEQQLQVYHLL